MYSYSLFSINLLVIVTKMLKLVLNLLIVSLSNDSFTITSFIFNLLIVSITLLLSTSFTFTSPVDTSIY